MKKTFHEDNHGFSLLELIVAVLILGIVSATAITAFGTVFNARSQAAADTAISLLKQTREKALALTQNSTNDTYCKFYLKGSDYYADIIRKKPAEGGSGTVEDVLASKKLGNDGLTLSFKSHSNSSIIENVSDSNSVIVYFSRETGGITKITAGSTVYPLVSGTMIDELLIQGSGDDREIVLVTATGRSYMPD